MDENWSAAPDEAPLRNGQAVETSNCNGGGTLPTKVLNRFELNTRVLSKRPDRNQIQRD